MYKLLITDDEPLTREYMQQNLSLVAEQWEVAGEASDGSEALEFLSQNKVDLVITDIKMPVMDGLELCKIISQKYPKQKVIILSGYDEFAFVQEAMRYGVNDYLLKPIVKQELQSALGKIARQLENDTRREQTFKVVSGLSEDYKKNIVKNFLKAIVFNSYVEIKSLYPLIHRLKIDVISSEGVIMLLSLDKDVVLKKSIPQNDIPIFSYILNEIAVEIVEDNKTGQVFLDAHENIVIFVTGETREKIFQTCMDIYAKISSFFLEHTGITVTGSIGSPQNELLQLNASYADALDTLCLQVISGSNKIYRNDNLSGYFNQISGLNKIIAAVKSGLLNDNELAYCTSLSDYVEAMDILDTSAILRYGVYLISSIKDVKRDYSPELVEYAYKTLQSIVSEPVHTTTKEKVVKLYTEIVKIFILDPLSEQNNTNEQSIIVKVKDFIYSHYAEPISLAQIAENVGVTSSYLSSIFHKSVGESYIKFLTRVRMEQAAKLLKHKPPVKIYDVSEKVGYVSVKHFAYVFKQYFNSTPGEYQNKKTE